MPWWSLDACPDTTCATVIICRRYTYAGCATLCQHVPAFAAELPCSSDVTHLLAHSHAMITHVEGSNHDGVAVSMAMSEADA